jgi:hypothetical protein
MATFPNTGLANINSTIKGSCKIEISTDGVTFTNLGLARGVIISEEWDSSDIQADNGPDLENYVSSHIVNLSWNSLELYLPNLNTLRGNIDTLSVTSAVATTRTDSWESSEWAFNQNLLLVMNGDSTTLPSITKVVTISTGGSCSTLTTGGLDFVKTLNASNKTGITILSTDFGGNALDTEDLRVTYTYASISARKLSSGGKSTISSRWFRLTNKEMIGGVAKYRYFTFYSGSVNAGLNMAFKSANEADPILEMPISIKCKLDTTRSEGDQLWAIEDQGAVA